MVRASRLPMKGWPVLDEAVSEAFLVPDMSWQVPGGVPSHALCPDAW